MANTPLQNCQKIIIVMELWTLFVVCIFLTIKIIKKKIDLSSRADQDSNQADVSRYRESQSSINIGRNDYATSSIKANTFTEYDTCTQRFMKKVCDINVTFNPLLIVLPLNFILGKSLILVVSAYFISTTLCLLFNVFKVHRACIQQKMVRLSLQVLWMAILILMLVNIWIQEPSSMLYLLVKRQS